MPSNKKYLIVLAGPTAVGKTGLAIKIAQNLKTVILSSDSRQFYREMEIGTAKPGRDELKAVQHFFINNKSLDELYGAGHFAKDADLLLKELFKKHDVVLLAGGSGLYIDALLNGVDEFDEVPVTVREQLNAEYREKGMDWLKAEVLKADPDFYNKADKQNPQRLIRALEIYRHTGKPFSQFRKKAAKQNNFIPVKILLTRERKELYDRINQRVDQMMDQGLLDEVKGLVSHQHLNALKTVGYRELYEYLQGKLKIEEAVDKIKQHTRNYAKRQLTWFRNKDDFHEIDASDEEALMLYIKRQIA